MRAFVFIVTAIGLSTLATAAVLFGGGCMAAPRWVTDPTEDDAPEARPVSDHLATPDDRDSESWTVRRVGGDLDARITGSNGDWRFDRSCIDTPLPDGYPPPTPPGAMELKKYPAVRRAEYTGRIHPNLGMNFGFWPLFRHIDRHDIAMTSPVEVDYHQWNGDASQPASWTMSFLYRRHDLHESGQDGQITIADNQPITVVSVGMNGPYSMETVRRGAAELRQWLRHQRDWEPSGEWRALFYNDPGVPRDRRWFEVQLPVSRSRMSSTQ